MATKRKVERPAAAAPARVTDTSLDVSALRQIVDILEASDVTRLSWRRGEERLFIRRGQPQTTTVVHAAPVSPSVSPVPLDYAQANRPVPTSPPGIQAPAPAPVAEKAGQVVTCPFVGTFYRTPAPDQPAFVEVGTTIRKGQVLCIIEAMKLMNEIEAEISGKVVEVLVENGQPVEFGQALFRIEPA